MLRFIAPTALFVLLTACGSTSMTGGGKMSDSVPDGVTVTAAPIAFFQQGVRGAENVPSSILNGTMTLKCLAEFDGRSVQDRANASAQLSSIGQTKMQSWPNNPSARNRILSSAFPASLDQHGCAPVSLDFDSNTRDEVEVAKFVLENDLLGAIATLGR